MSDNGSLESRTVFVKQECTDCDQSLSSSDKVEEAGNQSVSSTTGLEGSGNNAGGDSSLSLLSPSSQPISASRLIGKSVLLPHVQRLEDIMMFHQKS